MNYKVIWVPKNGPVQYRSFRHLDRAKRFFNKLRKNREVLEVTLLKNKIDGQEQIDFWNRKDWHI